MSEIKFRAWFKPEQKMYRVLSLVFGQREQEVTLVRYEGPYITCPLDEVELMQFTGLYDRNGKEIWEGDILRIDWHDDRYPPHHFEVKWDAENAGFAFEGGSPMHDASYYFEVIGNVYEHPDLLQ